MKEAAIRLRRAREAAGFAAAEDASRRFGWKTSTYRAHENAQNHYYAMAVEYADAFNVDPAWLIWGAAPEPPEPSRTGAKA